MAGLATTWGTHWPGAVVALNVAAEANMVAREGSCRDAQRERCAELGARELEGCAGMRGNENAGQ